MAPTRGTEKSFTPESDRGLLQVPAVLWTTDLHFRVTGCAGAAVALLGLSADSGQTVAALFRQSGPNPKILDAHFLAASGHPCTVDIELGGYDLRVRVEPIRDDRGAIQGVGGVAIDNSDSQVAQRALRISEQNYRTLIEEAPHAICRCTPSGSLLQANRAMQDLLGYSGSDLLMRNLQTEIFVDAKHYTAFVERLRGCKSCHGYETQWLQQTGRAVTVSLSGRAVCDAAGGVVYLDFFAENTSERKQLEEQFRQAQKMQAVGQLAGGIAHDFNNLLTVIRGQAEMMAEHLAAANPACSRLHEIQRAAERATALTRQLLAFSRRQVLQTKILNLNAVVANMNEMLARLIGRNIELSFSATESLWPVKIDPGQIEQVLMNLAVNARDAMPEGGRLIIETRNVAKSDNHGFVPAGEYVELTVRDTGHGMDDATKARIFEPFFTTKEAGKGTGLGLSVVYGVVKQSGGQVKVESRPGGGTTFYIYLPRSEGAAEDRIESSTGVIPQGTETILLVDDDEPIRRMVTDFLRMHGYRVLTARDGADALALLQVDRNVDLLLSDMTMPRMGGKELAAKVRHLLPELRVILMSGNPEDSPAGIANAHLLHKPFSIHTLGTLVRGVLDSDTAVAIARAGLS